MKVLLIWAQDRGKAVATDLRYWLKKVIPSLDPFMSEVDTVSGDRWQGRLDAVLEDTDFGIVCLTSENQSDRWVNYEAGACGKKVSRSRVIPYLLDMTETEVHYPLARFQAEQVTKDGTRKLLASINSAMPTPAIADVNFEETFEVWWPKLEPKLEIARAMPGSVPAKRLTDDMLNEIVGHLRELTAEPPHVTGARKVMQVLREVLSAETNLTGPILQVMGELNPQVYRNVARDMARRELNGELVRHGTMGPGSENFIAHLEERLAAGESAEAILELIRQRHVQVHGPRATDVP